MIKRKHTLQSTFLKNISYLRADLVPNLPTQIWTQELVIFLV